MEKSSSTYFVVKVDHLKKTTTKDYIQRTFSSFGEIKSVRLEQSEHPGENCAFVSYRLLEAANRAVEGMHEQMLNGIRLHVKVCGPDEFSSDCLKTAPTLPPIEGQEVSQKHLLRSEAKTSFEVCSTLKVSNISKATSEQAIKNTFARFPGLHSVKLIPVPDQSCNYAWVNYTDANSADKAQRELDQLCLDGNMLAVTLRDSKRTHQLPGSVSQGHSSKSEVSSTLPSQATLPVSDSSASSQSATARPTVVTTPSIFPKREPGIPVCISAKSSSFSKLVPKGLFSVPTSLKTTRLSEAPKNPLVPQPATVPHASITQNVGATTGQGHSQPVHSRSGLQSKNATSEVTLTFALDKLSGSVTKNDGIYPLDKQFPVDTATTNLPASSSPPSAKGQAKSSGQKNIPEMSADTSRLSNLQQPVSEAVTVSQSVRPNIHLQGLRSVPNRDSGGSARSTSTSTSSFSFRLPSPQSPEAKRVTQIPLRKHSLEFPETKADDTLKKAKLQQPRLDGSELTVAHTVLPSTGAPKFSQSVASKAVTSTSAVDSIATAATRPGLLLKQQGLDLGSSGSKHSISLHLPTNRELATSDKCRKGVTKSAMPKSKSKLEGTRPGVPSPCQQTPHPHQEKPHVPSRICVTSTTDGKGTSAKISTKPARLGSEKPVESLHDKQRREPTPSTASKNPFFQALPLQSTQAGDKVAQSSRLGTGMTYKASAKSKPMERSNSVTVPLLLPNALAKQILLSSAAPFGTRLQEIIRKHDVIVNQGQKDAEGSAQVSLSGVPSRVQSAAKELRLLVSEVQGKLTVKPMQVSHAAVPTVVTDKFQDTVKAIEESNSVRVSVSMRDLTSSSIRIGEFAREASALQTELLQKEGLLQVAHFFPRFITTKPTFDWHALNEQQQFQPVSPSVNFQLNLLYPSSGDAAFQCDSFEYAVDFDKLVLEEKDDCGSLKHYQLLVQPPLPVWSYYRDDDFGFVPHEPKVSKAIEGMLWYGGQAVEMEGSPHAIDFENMLQINLYTQTPVCLQREPPLPLLPHRIELQVAGLQESISEAVVKLQSAIDESQTCYKYTLPPTIRLSSVAPVRLYNESRRFCVESSLEESDDKLQLLLKGERQYVEHVKLKIKDLALEIQQERLHTHPLDIPAEWCPQSQPRELKLVREGDREWTWIKDRMKESIASVQLLAVERNQDIELWERYSFSKKCMRAKKLQQPDEKFLYHGTKSNDPKKICAEGFDFRLSNEGLWGRGAYFAEKASYSDSGYAYETSDGSKQLLLASVLTGDRVKLSPDRDLKRPPLKSSGTLSNGSVGEERYDSVTGFAGNSQIYIVYEHYKAYPAYLITYQTK